MIPVIFWGATGQAKVLRDALPTEGAMLVAVFDNRKIASPFDDIPIFHGESGFAGWERNYGNHGEVQACVAIGGIHGRDRLDRMHWLTNRGFNPMSIFHPRAFVSHNASFGDGCQILAMSAVCAHAKIGAGVIINTKASVDHDCVVGDGVHIAPGATLAGEVTVDECAFIGAGAVVLPGRRIGAHAIVGAGAVVTKNVAAGHTVVGNPARLRSPRHS
jgi:sugar O-acyltransferase (sialic acid O-acetyltransferase NeuD family)